jgi:hypothetical protein
MLGHNLPDFRIIRDHLQGNEDVIIIVFELRALCGVNDVFYDQRMEVKAFAKGLKKLVIMHPVDVVPQHPWIHRWKNARRSRGDYLLFHMIRRIKKSGNRDRHIFLLAYIYDRAR